MLTYVTLSNTHCVLYHNYMYFTLTNNPFNIKSIFYAFENWYIQILD